VTYYDDDRSAPGSGPSTTRLIAIGIAALVVLILVSTLWAASSETVSAGSACIVRANGRAESVAGPGRVWLTPFIDDLRCYETTEQSLEYTGQDDSDADFTDSVITHQSKDGVSINVAALVKFRVPPENLMDIHNLYAKDMNGLVERRLQDVARNTTRAVIEERTIEELYPAGTGPLSVEVEKRLAAEFEERGVVLTSFAITAIDPGGEYKAAIEAQQQEREKAALAIEQQAVAQEEAEVARIRAEGEANAAIEAANGQAEAAKVQADADAYVTTSNAESDSQANEKIAASLTPELVQLKYYEALQNANWAIFSPEDVMPTFPVQTPEE
jgi:regulator of protease activity HflC (stomatin/prohibitin superfamily)